MLAAITAGLVLGLTAGLSPGPLLALAISQTLKHSLKEGLKVCVAPLITDLPIALAALFVLSRVRDAEAPLGFISLAGAAFVLWLAYQGFRPHTVNIEDMPDEPRSLRKAIMVNFLNPNPYLFWSTVGASMVTRAWEHSVWAVVAFLVLLYALLVGMQMLMAVLAHRSRAFLGGRAHRWVMRLLSVALLVFAGLLLRDGIARLAQAWSA